MISVIDNVGGAGWSWTTGRSEASRFKLSGGEQRRVIARAVGYQNQRHCWRIERLRNWTTRVVGRVLRLFEV